MKQNPFQLTVLSLAVLASFTAHSESSKNTKTTDSVDLNPMVVTATRSEVSELSAPVNVTVVDNKTIERRQTLRIGDALKDVPGL